jgi:type VI secretion system protein ImpE
VFLFQLLSVMGQWDRALTQLNVAGELDAEALPMVQTYREAIQCEALRAEIFAGKRAPLIFGEPQDWLACWSRRCVSTPPTRPVPRRCASRPSSRRPRRRQHRRRSLRVADGCRPAPRPGAGSCRQRPLFLDSVQPHRRIEIDAPADLRDTVWTAATFTWANGAQAVGLIPTRYERQPR